MGSFTIGNIKEKVNVLRENGPFIKSVIAKIKLRQGRRWEPRKTTNRVLYYFKELHFSFISLIYQLQYALFSESFEINLFNKTNHKRVKTVVFDMVHQNINYSVH